MLPEISGAPPPSRVCVRCQIRPELSSYQSMVLENLVPDGVGFSFGKCPQGKRIRSLLLTMLKIESHRAPNFGRVVQTPLPTRFWGKQVGGR